MTVSNWRSVGLLVLILFIAAAGFGQVLPANFDYKKLTERDPEPPSFMLNPNIDALTADAMKGKAFGVLGAGAQPERGNYLLIFWNVAAEYQFSTSSDKSCEVTTDGVSTRKLRFTDSPNRREIGKLRVEAAAIEIGKVTFERLMKAREASIRCGPVRYTLTKDNSDALVYFTTEISNDLKRRGAVAK